MHRYVGAEVAGGLGAGNEWDESGRMPVVKGTLHYEFAGWLGDDLVTTSGYWLVTPRLADALRASELTGYTLADVVVTKDEQWDAMPQRDDFPDRWERLIPTGTEDGGEDFVLSGGTDLLVSDQALDLLRRFRIDNAEIGDDEQPDTAATETPAATAPDTDPAAAASPARPDLPRIELPAPNGTTITGDVTLAITALGLPPDDDRVRTLLELMPGFETKTAQDPGRGEVEMHVNRTHGLDLRFRNGELDQVTFNLKAGSRRGAYPWPEALIEGLPVPQAKRAQVLERLGDPYDSALPFMDRFKIGDGHVHFGWSKGGERTIVVLREP